MNYHRKFFTLALVLPLLFLIISYGAVWPNVEAFESTVLAVLVASALPYLIFLLLLSVLDRGLKQDINPKKRSLELLIIVLILALPAAFFTAFWVGLGHIGCGHNCLSTIPTYQAGSIATYSVLLVWVIAAYLPFRWARQYIQSKSRPPGLLE